MALSIGLFMGANNAIASHFSGGNLQMIPTGNANEYTIKLVTYRDCLGIQPNNSESISVTSACGLNLSLSTPLVNVDTIGLVCPQQASLSSCNGGPITDYQEFTYETVAVLGYCAGGYTLEWGDCCRNTIVNVHANAPNTDLFLQSEYFPSSVSANSPPTIYPFTDWIACLGMPTTVAATAYDPEGDSLSYTLMAPLVAANTPILYDSLYSVQQPIPGMTFDSITGLASFYQRNKAISSLLCWCKSGMNSGAC